MIKFVYLAHPFASDPEANRKRVNNLAASVVRRQIERTGTFTHMPFVPHNLLQYVPEETSPALRVLTEDISCRMVRFCDELWICAPTISRGMTLEIAAAKEAHIPVVSYSDLLPMLGVSECTQTDDRPDVDA